MAVRIKKDDLVVVTSGKDKGKQGNIIIIDRKKEQAMVKGVCLVTRHIKARRQGETSRISKEEGFVPFCKLMPICPSCKKACRMTVQNKLRACHRCKEAF
ncbi:50S ribosomal protein L24 [Candidatus Dependentiae bacterium]|nr:50S ribosomal protein L24 [Candidatus Dependentiae bacterium]